MYRQHPSLQLLLVSVTYVSLHFVFVLLDIVNFQCFIMLFFSLDFAAASVTLCFAFVVIYLVVTYVDL